MLNAWEIRFYSWYQEFNKFKVVCLKGLWYKIDIITLFKIEGFKGKILAKFGFKNQIFFIEYLHGFMLKSFTFLGLTC